MRAGNSQSIAGTACAVARTALDSGLRQRDCSGRLAACSTALEFQRRQPCHCPPARQDLANCYQAALPRGQRLAAIRPGSPGYQSLASDSVLRAIVCDVPNSRPSLGGGCERPVASSVRSVVRRLLRAKSGRCSRELESHYRSQSPSNARTHWLWL